MKWSTQVAVLVLASFAPLVAARNSLYFTPHDHVERVVVFTHAEGKGHAKIPDHIALPGQSFEVFVPEGWEGRFEAILPGRNIGGITGVIGEVKFQGFPNGQNTYFDVSAVDNHIDRTGIHRMYPVNRPNDPRSGCREMPCTDVYMFWDDEQTKSSTATEFVVEMGVPTSDAELGRPY